MTTCATSSSKHTPRSIKFGPTPSMVEEDGIYCSGHNMRANRFISGAQAKNPNRAFYVCSLSQKSADRCKFFLWEDQTPQLSNIPRTPSAHRSVQISVAGAHTRDSPSKTCEPSLGLLTPHSDSKRRMSTTEASGEEEEREAIAISRCSTRKNTPDTIESIPTPRFNEKLRDAMKGSKRTREDDPNELVRTPKKANIERSPFVSSPPGRPATPLHRNLFPSISCLEQLNEHLHRQDRLLAAAEQMKTTMRKTVKSLQEKNKILEDRVRELESRLAQ
ncbi:uncharacterized protein L203_102760 [Cryptococcus depauperatus CBS 7841]|uniref:GRF-type domain-containing protein n=1 Tax=Cryptococcus depauperatus CBS 7841 TaxID=1295531 RepID=A0AAJ8JSB5_9TREE